MEKERQAKTGPGAMIQAIPIVGELHAQVKSLETRLARAELRDGSTIVESGGEVLCWVATTRNSILLEFKSGGDREKIEPKVLEFLGSLIVAK